MNFNDQRILIAMTAYVTRDWKIFMQVFAAAHLVTPILMTLVPESPRWLISVNRTQVEIALYTSNK